MLHFQSMFNISLTKTSGHSVKLDHRPYALINQKIPCCNLIMIGNKYSHRKVKGLFTLTNCKDNDFITENLFFTLPV